MRLDARAAEVFDLTRTKAKQLILDGGITVNGREIRKPAYETQDSDCLEQVKTFAFASLGGDKLEKALQDFAYDCGGRVCLDIGASNGGFTDCLLTHGARKVYAVDVGACALAERLIVDPRVVVKDRTNARALTAQDLGELCDLCTIDVSFISLELILPAAANCLRAGGDILALIKPQFECGKKYLSKTGIVRDPDVHRRVCAQVERFAQSIGLEKLGLTDAPIKEDKNREFLIYLRKKY